MLPARNTTNDSTMTPAPAALMNSAALADHAETTDTPLLPLGGPGRTAGGFSCFVEGTEARRHPSAGTEARRHGGTQQNPAELRACGASVDLGRLVEMNKDGEAIEISIAEAIGLGRVRYAGLGASRREAVDRTLSLGRWMAQVREHVPHGMFERLVTDHGMNPRTVRLAIELADAVAAHGVDPAAFGTVRQLRRACGLHVAQASVTIPNAGRNRNHVSDLESAAGGVGGRTSRDGGGGVTGTRSGTDGAHGTYAVRDIAAMRELYIKAGPTQVEEFFEDDGLEVVEVGDGELEGLEGLEDEGDDDEDNADVGADDVAGPDQADHRSDAPDQPRGHAIDRADGVRGLDGTRGDVVRTDVVARIGGAGGAPSPAVHAEGGLGDACDRAGEVAVGAGGDGDAVGSGVHGDAREVRGGEGEGTSDERRATRGAECQPAAHVGGAGRVDAGGCAAGDGRSGGRGYALARAGGESQEADGAGVGESGLTDAEKAQRHRDSFATGYSAFGFYEGGGVGVEGAEARRHEGTQQSGIGSALRASGGVPGAFVPAQKPVQLTLAECYVQAERVRALAARIEAGSLSDEDLAAVMEVVGRIERKK